MSPITPPTTRTVRTQRTQAIARFAARGSDADQAQDYRSFFDNAVEGIFRTSPEGRYLVVNRALAAMYGYASPEDLLGSVTDIASQLYVDPQRRAIFRMLLSRQDTVSGFEAEVRRRDGSTRWIREKARVVRDAQGSVACYEGFVEDISEERQVRDGAALCERALACSPDALALFARDGAMAWGNAAFADLLGKERRTLDAVLAWLESRGVAPAWTANRATMMRCGVSFRDEIAAREVSGAARPLRWTAYPVTGAGGAELIAVAFS
jgi:PAS domain S-box-containing protein